MQLHKAFGSDSAHVRNLDLPMRSLYLLAAPSTPEPARTEVIQRAEAGEHFTHAQVKEIVDKAVAEHPPRHEARQDARHHGGDEASDFSRENICA
jgi:hypothetical protein